MRGFSNRQKRQKILDAAWKHAENECDIGRKRALEQAISEMIGAAEFLALRLGKSTARQAVMRLHDAI